MSKKKFEVELDAVRITQITVYVEAKDAEEARLLAVAGVFDPSQLEVEVRDRYDDADEIEVRYIKDQETGKVTSY